MPSSSSLWSPRFSVRGSRSLALFLSLACSGLAACGGRVDYVEIKGPAQTYTLTIKGKTITVELAADDRSQRLGLMFRKPEELPRDQGMIFVQRSPERRSFHMKNTLIPLSIAFIADDGRILQIEDMKPKDEGLTQSKDEVRIALEMHQGWFRDNGVQVGDRFGDLDRVLQSAGAD